MGGEGSFASCHVNTRPEAAYRKAKCVIIVCTAGRAALIKDRRPGQRAGGLSVTFPAAGQPLLGVPSCGPDTSLPRKQ
jgi:hypothetical protein